MKALILAAGLGTRLGEETRYLPKALVEVAGKPLLQHAIEKMKREGISTVTVNVHHFSRLVMEFLECHDFGIPVSISDETGQLLDTGGALKKAAPLLAGDEPVLVYNVDVLSNLKLIDLLSNHIRSKALATLVVRERPTQRYFKFDREKQLVGWLNKASGEKIISVPGKFKDATEMAFSGIHIVDPKIFELFPAGDRFSVTHWYLDLAQNHSIKGFFDTSRQWIDVGKPEQLKEARKRWKG